MTTNSEHPLTETQRRGLAVHEAGHLVVGWRLGLKLTGAAIDVRDDRGGQMWFGSSDEHLPLIDRAAVGLAGIRAQHMFGAPTAHPGGGRDFELFLKMTVGMGDEERERTRLSAFKRAEAILIECKVAALRVAEFLAAHGRIDEADLARLLAPD